jgi:hypothetical protein
MKRILLMLAWIAAMSVFSQNRDPLKTEIVTTDIDNFWITYEAAKPDFRPEIFQKLYLDKGSNGLNSFLKSKIKSADRLAKAVSSHPKYFGTLKKSTDTIPLMKDAIRNSLVKLKTLYPKAIFPPVYFVIGAMNSGGTSSDDGLLIGAEMFGIRPNTDMTELNDWHKTVLKPEKEVPHIVAHELVHFQQKYDGGTLLAACIKEGGADFIAELISGKHINQHVHDFANPREAELWAEFKSKMNAKDYTGWLYSNTPGRPKRLRVLDGLQNCESLLR